VSQPCDKNCDVPAPGEVDEQLKEFWAGNPWTVFQQHNLSSFERNRVFLNVRGQNFLEISALTDADIDSDSRAVLAIDTRSCGQLDLLVRSVGGGPLAIFENQFPAKSYLMVSLRGAKSNRQGIGARLVARIGDRQIVRELYPANTYRSQAPALVHFGLDGAQRVDELLIRWPSGTEQVIRAIPANRHVLIHEAREQYETVEPGRSMPQ
jgi:enediyne biosynthesis protein E4